MYLHSLPRRRWIRQTVSYIGPPLLGPQRGAYPVEHAGGAEKGGLLCRRHLRDQPGARVRLPPGPPHGHQRRYGVGVGLAGERCEWTIARTSHFFFFFDGFDRMLGSFHGDGRQRPSYLWHHKYFRQGSAAMFVCSGGGVGGGWSRPKGRTGQQTWPIEWNKFGLGCLIFFCLFSCHVALPRVCVSGVCA